MTAPTTQELIAAAAERPATKKEGARFDKLTEAQQARARELVLQLADGGKPVTATWKQAMTDAVAQLPAEPEEAPEAPEAPEAERPVPAGYENRWPYAAYDVLKKTAADAEGPAWLVRCNAHGATTAAASVKAAFATARHTPRAEWCDGCKADEADEAAPAKK